MGRRSPELRGDQFRRVGPFQLQGSLSDAVCCSRYGEWLISSSSFGRWALNSGAEATQLLVSGATPFDDPNEPETQNERIGGAFSFGQGRQGRVQRAPRRQVHRFLDIRPLRL